MTLGRTLRGAIGATAAALTLCLPAGTNAAPAALVVGYTSIPDFAAAFIAKDEGLFARHGLDVTLQQLPLTSNIPPALMSDSIQIGGTTPPVFFQAADSGLDLIAVAGGSLFEKMPPTIGLVARNGLHAPADFVGRKVAIPGLNGTLHVMMRQWLANHGVDAKQVDFVEVPLPRIPGVMQGGSVDAAITAEPFVSRITQAKAGDLVPAFTDDAPAGFSAVMYAASRQWAVQHPEQVQAFRAALGEAIALADKDPARALDDLSKYFKVPAAVLKATPWPHLVTDITDAQMRFWYDAMRSQGMLKKPVMLSSMLMR